MREKLTAIGAGLALTLLSSSAASALTITDMRFVGTVVDGVPSSEANEVNYINSLVTQALGTTVACTLEPTEQCIRSSNVLPLTLANSTDFTKDQTGAPFFVAGSFEYIIAKYGSAQSDGGEYVFWIAGLTGPQTLPTTFGPGGPALSHFSRVNATATTVPDGGATAALLGLGMAGLGVIRRRISR